MVLLGVLPILYQLIVYPNEAVCAAACCCLRSITDVDVGCFAVAQTVSLDTLLRLLRACYSASTGIGGQAGDAKTLELQSLLLASRKNADPGDAATGIEAVALMLGAGVSNQRQHALEFYDAVAWTIGNLYRVSSCYHTFHRIGVEELIRAALHDVATLQVLDLGANSTVVKIPTEFALTVQT
eukprot:Rmarinus@m.23821